MSAAVGNAPPSPDELRAVFVEHDVAHLADPYPLFARLRETAPVFPLGSIVLVTPYGLAREVLRDNRTFSKQLVREAAYAGEVRGRLSDEDRRRWDDLDAFHLLMVSRLDDPEHARLRRIAHRAFTPRAIDELELAIERYTADLLDTLRQDDVCDMMEFAYRLPLLVIADLLGVPAADRESIHDWSASLGRSHANDGNPAVLRDAHAAMQAFRSYIDDMLEEHRTRRTGLSGLVATMVDAEQEERLTPDELTAMFVILLLAGHETTTGLIGVGLYELLRQRDQWERLCADPDGLAASATEELLRYVTPVQYLSRTPFEDCEIAGVPVAAGQTVFSVMAASNRDPEVFERPDTLDLARPEAGKHLSFGVGVSFCLGNALARAEGRIAFASLARRFPDLEPAGEVAWRSSALRRLLSVLPVRLGKERAA